LLDAGVERRVLALAMLGRCLATFGSPSVRRM
jgi:hypothetical protein